MASWVPADHKQSEASFVDRRLDLLSGKSYPKRVDLIHRIGIGDTDHLGLAYTQNFANIGNPSWRAEFVRSAVQLVEDVGLDG
jgi:hypothetical protein